MVRIMTGSKFATLIRGDDNAEINLLFNSNWEETNIIELLEFKKLYIAFHTGVSFIEFILAENTTLDSRMVLRKLRLSYIRKRCDWMGGPEKYPFSSCKY